MQGQARINTTVAFASFAIVRRINRLGQGLGQSGRPIMPQNHTNAVRVSTHGTEKAGLVAPKARHDRIALSHTSSYAL